MSDLFRVKKDYQSLQSILERVARKHKVSVAEMKYNRHYSRRPSNAIADARSEYAYEAYKTGNFSMSNIARGINRIAANEIGTRKGDAARTRVLDLINRHCRIHGLDFPHWPRDSKPYWRTLENEQDKDESE